MKKVIYIVFLLVILSLFLIIRLLYVEKQINSLIKQLKFINENKINKKLTIGLLNKKVEVLSERINDTLQEKIKSEESKVKLENELRQTIANMSHDLRTPLTSIIGYIQFLKMDEISQDEKIEYLNVAEQRAKSLERLINDFYELSLIHSLDYEIDMKKISINKILQDLVLERYADFINRNIKPGIDIPKKNIYIIAEKKSLERIIENLITNAIKYAKDSIQILLVVENNNVMLKISNTFVGLTEEDVDNVFNRFYLADKTRSGKGTGLGLAITKGLVEKMNGNISANVKDDMFNITCSFCIINS